MIMRRNLVKNLKGFYQQTGGLHRFYSQALVDANQSEISSKEDPFSLVEDEVSQIGNFVREQVAKAAELMIPDPNLALGATNYYFKRFPVEKFRLTVPLLMASALNAPISDNLRARQHCIVKNTEFIDVASLFQDGLLLDADKLRGFRSIYPLNSDQIRGIESLNCVMREQNAPMTFAREEFPELGKVIAELDYDYYCDYPSSIAVMIEALEYVKASKGIERTIELAKEYSNRAKEIIGELPNSDDVSVLMHRKALIDLSDWAIKRMNKN